MILIPFHALFAADGVSFNDDLPEHPWTLLASAEAVVAVDVMTGGRLLVFGKTVLEQIAAGESPLPASTVAVELDLDTDELRQLIDLVRFANGVREHA